MALNALVDSFLPQSEKNVGMKGLVVLIKHIPQAVRLKWLENAHSHPLFRGRF